MAKRKKKVEDVAEEEVIMEVEEEVVEMESENEEIIVVTDPYNPFGEVVDTGMVKVLVTANVKYKWISYKRFEQLNIPAEEAKASKWCTVL